MSPDDARARLRAFDEDNSPVELTPSILEELSVDDMPDGAAFHIGTLNGGVVHLDWSGTLKREGTRVFGEADHT